MPSSTIKRQPEFRRDLARHGEEFDGVAIWLFGVSVLLGMICGNVAARRRR